MIIVEVGPASIVLFQTIGLATILYCVIMAETLATSAGAGAETQIKTAVVRRPRRPASLAREHNVRHFVKLPSPGGTEQSGPALH